MCVCIYIYIYIYIYMCVCVCVMHLSEFNSFAPQEKEFNSLLLCLPRMQDSL